MEHRNRNPHRLYTLSFLRRSLSGTVLALVVCLVDARLLVVTCAVYLSVPTGRCNTSWFNMIASNELVCMLQPCACPCGVHSSPALAVPCPCLLAYVLVDSYLPPHFGGAAVQPRP
eukprot:6089443-Amphidinium_carterae.1